MADVYAVNIGDLREADISSCRAIISDYRREKTDRFRFEKDRIRCIMGESVIRYVMEIFWGVSQKMSVFSTDKNGRPLLASSTDMQYDFNISHAGDWVVCSFGTERSGIDVERVSEYNDHLAEGILTIREAETLKALPSEKKVQSLCQIWTLKESYTKQIGVGLFQPFREIETQQLDPMVWEIAGDSQRIMFSQPWDNDYYLSLCMRASDNVPSKITTLDAQCVESYFMQVSR